MYKRQGLIDLRLPLTFTPADVAQIARIIRAEALSVGQAEEEALRAFAAAATLAD